MAYDDIFHRPELAAKLTRRMLVKPGQKIIASEPPLSYGAFLTGLPGIGKTTFLTHDLVPALEDAGAIVIYVPSEEDGMVNPEKRVLRFIRKALEGLKSKSESHLRTDGQRVNPATWKMRGLELSFDVDRVGEKDGVRLHEAFLEVVEEAETSIVLIIDEVQEISKSPGGHGLMWSLKTARDTINHTRGRKGDFVFLGAGSHPAMIQEMVMDGHAAYRGVMEVPYPLLGSDYVEFALKVFEREGATKLPSLTAAVRAFEVMGHEPRELFDAIEELQKTSAAETLDESLLKIAERRALAIARIELMKVILMGDLPLAIFNRISSDESESQKPLSRSARSEYSKAVGREVKVHEAMQILNALVAANLILLKEEEAVICYRVTNPLTRKLCLKELQPDE